MPSSSLVINSVDKPKYAVYLQLATFRFSKFKIIKDLSTEQSLGLKREHIPSCNVIFIPYLYYHKDKNDGDDNGDGDGGDAVIMISMMLMRTVMMMMVVVVKMTLKTLILIMMMMIMILASQFIARIRFNNYREALVITHYSGIVVTRKKEYRFSWILNAVYRP